MVLIHVLSLTHESNNSKNSKEKGEKLEKKFSKINLLTNINKTFNLLTTTRGPTSYQQPVVAKFCLTTTNITRGGGGFQHLHLFLMK